MGRTKAKPQFENLGSLITIKNQKTCLGYLMVFADRGVFDAEYGKVDVSPEHAETHNKLLDAAMLSGLDNRCEVGQTGTFYVKQTRTGTGTITEIRTWVGTVVAGHTDVDVQNGPRRGIKLIAFTRNGKRFRGTWDTNEDAVQFQRVA